MTERSQESRNQKSEDRSREPASQEPVWTYRGYTLDAGNFTTSMVHLFRAEITRANLWRQRLDATTNWAVITTGAAISIAFTEAEIGHLAIILNTLLITLFLFIEARRYRYYELWSYRVRLMETDFFAAMLVPPFRPAADWAETLAENLLHPVFPISIWEAVGRRLRRNYGWMYAILGLAWLVKLWLHPVLATDLQGVFARATVGPIPGWAFAVLGVLFNGALLLLGLLTLGLHEATGEVLPRFMEADELAGVPGREPAFRRRAWFRPSRRRRQFLALIVSDCPDEVAQRVLRDMHRGVTSLAALGMYTGQAHSLLLCALTVTEVPQLKALVSEVDPNAFVILSPAHEILGRGFAPLDQTQE